MSKSLREAERLYAKSLDNLYEELGRSLPSTDYARPRAVSRLVAVERGRSFVSGSLERLKAKICTDWAYCSKRNEYDDFKALSYAIAPLVSSVVGVPAATGMVVTIILVKMGLDKLCNCPET